MPKKHYLSYYLWLLFLLIILGFGIWVFAQGTAISWIPWYERPGMPILGQILQVMKA